MDFGSIIEKISKKIIEMPNIGQVANYIPALANVNPNKFGINLCTINGENFSFADANEKFSIQSIAKVFALTLAYKELGSDLWQRVGVEPSGSSFNSLALLEYEQGIPRNPFINAGALVISDILLDLLKNPKEDFLNFVKKISNNSQIKYNQQIAESEKKTGYKNAAIVNLMKSFGNIKNNINDVLDFYFDLCSIEMSCTELSNTFMLYATGGVLRWNGERILSTSKTKRINAIMQTCGFYDEAGEFTFKVGLPGKSGVGGGIAAVFPGQYAVAVWSPPLNKKGNSVKGFLALELLTTETQLSIF
jgi:glutaminase